MKDIGCAVLAVSASAKRQLETVNCFDLADNRADHVTANNFASTAAIAPCAYVADNK